MGLEREPARRLACDAACTQVTHGSGGGVEVGRPVRTIPPRLRAQLMARDRGCGVADCDCPPEWTEGHHIRHWINGGATVLANVVLLCWAHHRPVHEAGWRIRWGADGRLEAEPP